MNEEAIKDAFEIFKAGGYNGSQEDFLKLISTNKEAYNDAFSLFSSAGYTGGEDGFSELLGISKKKESAEELPLEDSLLVSEETIEDGGLEPTSDIFETLGFKEKPKTELEKFSEEVIAPQKDREAVTFVEKIRKEHPEWFAIKDDNILNEKEKAAISRLDVTKTPEYVSKVSEIEKTIDKDLEESNIDDFLRGYEDYMRNPESKMSQFWLKNLEKPFANFLEEVESSFSKPTLEAIERGENLSASELKERIRQSRIEEKARKVRTDLSDDLAESMSKSSVDRINSFLSFLAPEEPPSEREAYLSDLQSASEKLKKHNTEFIEKGEKLQTAINSQNVLYDFYKKDPNNMPPDVLKKFLSDVRKTTALQDDLSRNYANINKEMKRLGTVEEEIDSFKRRYDNITVGSKALVSSLIDLAAGGMSLADMGIDTVAFLADDIETPFQAAAEWMNGASNALREEIARSKSIEDVDSIGDFMGFAGRTIVDQLPQLALMALTKGKYRGPAILGGIAAGNKYLDVSKDENLSKLQKIIGSTAVGLSEFGTEVVTAGIIRDAFGKVIKSVPPKEIRDAKKFFKNSLKEGYEKRFDVLAKGASAAVKEGGSEVAATVIENIVDRYILEDKDATILRNVPDALVSGAIIGAGMRVAPEVFSSVVSPFVDRVDLLKENSKKINELIDTLPKIKDKETRDATKKQIEELEEINSAIISSAVERIDDMSPEQRNRVFEIQKEIQSLKRQYREIDRDEDLTKEEKNAQNERIFSKYNELIKEKDAIQKQITDEVPVRDDAEVSEEVEERVPEPRPEEVTEEIEFKEEEEVDQTEADIDAKSKIRDRAEKDFGLSGFEIGRVARNEDGNIIAAEVKYTDDSGNEVVTKIRTEAPAPTEQGTQAPVEKTKLRDNIKKAVSKVFTKTDSRSFKNGKEMFDYAKSEYNIEIGENERARVFTKPDGSIEILLNEELADDTSFGHEVWHPILLKVFGDNQKKFTGFRESINNTLRKNGYTDLADNLDEFANQYEEVPAEEYLAELGGILTAAKIDVNNLTEKQKTLLDQIKEIVNNIMVELTGEPVFLEDATPADILDFMSTMSDMMARGEDISGFVKPTKTDKKGNLPKPTTRAQKALIDKNKKIEKDTKEKVSTGDNVSTRITSTGEPHKRNDLIVSTDVIIEKAKTDKNAKAFAIKLASVLSSYPSVNIDSKSIDSVEKAEEVFNKLKDSVKSNLKWLYDQFSDEVRTITKLWYDGANIVSNEIADQYGYTTNQVAGVMAVLSPQMDWFRNLSLGKRVIDIYSTKMDSTMDSKMEDYIREAGTVSKDGKKKFLFEGPAQKLTEKNVKLLLEEMRGKTFKEMSIPEKAFFIRAYDEVYNTRDYENISPTGEVNGFVMTGKGERAKVGWGGFGPIMKSISILENGSIENISQNLGNQHKVRNFFVNISNPTDANAVTIDTHAVAAALLKPLAGSDAEVSTNLSGPPKSASTGLVGSYPVMADAYRELANELGILPRELQSITWEAVRGLYKASFKTAKNKKVINDLWERYRNNELTEKQVYEEINSKTGGVSKPVWYEYVAEGDVKTNEENSAAIDQGKLSDDYRGERPGPDTEPTEVKTRAQKKKPLRVFATRRNTKKVTVNEKQALLDLIRAEAKAAREAVAASRAVAKSVRAELMTLYKKGLITTRQMNAILNRALTLNFLNTDHVTRFVDYMERVYNNAEYADNLKKAESTKKKIKRAVKDKTIQAETRDIAKTFLQLEPFFAENIKEYLEVAEDILNATSVTVGRVIDGEPSVSFKQAMNYEKVVSYTEGALEFQEKTKRDELLRRNKELVERGLISEDMSLEEIREVMKALEEDSDKLPTEEKQKIIREYVNNYYESYKKVLTQIIKTKVDPLSGETIPLTSEQIKIVKRFLNVDLKTLSLKDAYKVIEAIDNFIVNQNTDGMLGSAKAYEGEEDAVKAEKMGLKGRSLRAFWSKGFGRGWAEKIEQLPLVVDRIFGGAVSGSKIMKLSGLADLLSVKNFAIRKYNKYVENYSKQFEKIKDFNSVENIFERAMLAYVSRTSPGTEIQMRNEFKKRKKNIERSIANMKGPEASEKQKEDAKVLEKIYDRILRDSDSASDVSKKSSKTNRLAVSYWQAAFSNIFDDMQSVSRGVYNTVLERDLKYTPDVYSRLKGRKEESIEKIANSSFFGINDKFDMKESGGMMVATKPELQETSERVVSFDFDLNMAKSFKAALTDIETAPLIRKVDAFFNSESFLKMVPQSEDRDLLKARIAGYIRATKQKDFQREDELDKGAKLLNYISTFSAARALGGLSQIPKQTIPVILNTLINTKGRTGLTEVFKAKNFIDNSGYAIGLRGIASQADIQSQNKILKRAEQSKGAKSLEALRELNQWYLEKLVAKPDVFVARASWLAYYKESLAKQGFDTKDIDWDTHKLNREAADFAQKSVDKQQNYSDADLAGDILRSRKPTISLLRKTLFPFATFMLNKRSVLIGDISTLQNPLSSKEDKAAARLSLAANASEMALFHALSISITTIYVKVAAALLGIDQDDEEEEERKLRNKMYRVKNVVNEYLSPLPNITDEYVDDAINSLLEATGVDEKYRLPKGFAQDFSEKIGMIGIQADKLLVAEDMAKAAATGKLSYRGKEYELSKEDKEIMSGIATSYGMYAMGTLPADIGYISSYSYKMLIKKYTSGTGRWGRF